MDAGKQWHSSSGMVHLQAQQSGKVHATSNGSEAGLKQPATLSWPGRSHLCSGISEDNVDEEVRICGWVHRNRNMGGLVFSDIRDHTGIFQARLHAPCQS